MHQHKKTAKVNDSHIQSIQQEPAKVHKKPRTKVQSSATVAVESEQRSCKPFSYWLEKNKYYHEQIKKFYRFAVPLGSSVLQVNAQNGYILDALKPSFGVGIDQDDAVIADARTMYDYEFHHASLATFTSKACFDYVILSYVTMETEDILELFKDVQRFCHEGTRIVIDSYSYAWEPILYLTQKWGWRRPMVFKNYLSRADLEVFLHLASFEVVTKGRHLLMPIYIPVISWLCNMLLAQVPLIRSLCMNEWIIARPTPIAARAKDYTVSVIVACKNEKGTIEEVVRRCPDMGKATELIFVDGHSTDGTVAEIERVAQLYQERNISWFVQKGVGKGEGMRQAFARAQGDVLMILDGDLQVDPEALPQFFEALIGGKGEFINGSRMVYDMEPGAMRFVRMLANFGFSIIFTWLLGQRVKDTLCGTKVLLKKDYLKIAKNRAYFGEFDPFGDFDLLFGAARLNLKIVDMPVHYRQRTYGVTQINPIYHVWFCWA